MSLTNSHHHSRVRNYAQKRQGVNMPNIYARAFWDDIYAHKTNAGETGALVRIETTGAYVQVNAGTVRNLDGRKIAAALGITGRPPIMRGGKRVNVYLDDASLITAAALGSGNVSEGIRLALAGQKLSGSK